MAREHCRGVGGIDAIDIAGGRGLVERAAAKSPIPRTYVCMVDPPFEIWTPGTRVARSLAPLTVCNAFGSSTLMDSEEFWMDSARLWAVTTMSAMPLSVPSAASTDCAMDGVAQGIAAAAASVRLPVLPGSFLKVIPSFRVIDVRLSLPSP